ncbi:MAG: PLP-dependent transferase [Pirellulales bacterium]
MSEPIVPHVDPIYLSSVYECASPDEADARLGGVRPGYVYQRDGHPNAAALAEECRKLHGAEKAIALNSGMSAMALALLARCRAGDHVVLSDRLYGKTYGLFGGEAERLGIASTVVDTADPGAVRTAWRPTTRLLVVEAITNPLLTVGDLPGLAALAHKLGGELLVDNTLASPCNCRPFDHGADWVVESLTKIMNGHSDVVLGVLCGKASAWERVPAAASTWGWTAPPFESWLAARGLVTLALRWERAADNALAVARWLRSRSDVRDVHYPGLPDHPNHALARTFFTSAAVVKDGLRRRVFDCVHRVRRSRRRDALHRRIVRTNSVLPDAGNADHVAQPPGFDQPPRDAAAARQALGIDDGTIRLSVGIEPVDDITTALEAGLAALR